MIKERKGNLMEAKEDILAHQVNCRGRMGAGVAKQIRKRLFLENQYQAYRKECCQYGADLLGMCELMKKESEKWNCQEKCSRINSLNSFSTYAARSSSCSVRYTTGGYPPGLDV